MYVIVSGLSSHLLFGSKVHFSAFSSTIKEYKCPVSLWYCRSAFIIADRFIIEFLSGCIITYEFMFLIKGISSTAFICEDDIIMQLCAENGC